MSRIGKKPITIPKDTTVTIQDGLLSVKGPQGELSRQFNSTIEIEVSGETITLKPKKQDLQTLTLWGTYASHIWNMVEGVNKPFEKKLVIEGIGFRAEVKGTKLVMLLGFSHPVEMEIPAGLKVKVEKENMTITGIDKESVGQFAAQVREVKKPEPYKGKGIHYHDERVRRKQGKRATA